MGTRVSIPRLTGAQSRIARSMIDAIRMAEQATYRSAPAAKMRRGEPVCSHSVSGGRYADGVKCAAKAARKLSAMGVNPYSILVASGITATQLRAIHAAVSGGKSNRK